MNWTNTRAGAVIFTVAFYVVLILALIGIGKLIGPPFGF